MMKQEREIGQEVFPGPLRTVFPTVQFKKGRWIKEGKRAIRIYRKTLCVSASGKLLAVQPTGCKTCVCDLKQTPLYDFGSTVEARKQVQGIAPVANFERLGLKKKGMKPGKSSDFAVPRNSTIPAPTDMPPASASCLL
jgi:hypothetical protein